MISMGKPGFRELKSKAEIELHMAIDREAIEDMDEEIQILGEVERRLRLALHRVVISKCECGCKVLAQDGLAAADDAWPK